MAYLLLLPCKYSTCQPPGCFTSPYTHCVHPHPAHTGSFHLWINSSPLKFSHLANIAHDVTQTSGALWCGVIKSNSSVMSFLRTHNSALPWEEHQTYPDWGTRYVASSPQDPQGHETKQRLRNCLRPEKTEKPWQLNAMWFPLMDPETEGGH